MSTTVKRKHINEITEEFKPFWENTFKELGVENPLFFAKLCYNGNDFTAIDGSSSPVFRFYAEQISKGQDVYVEMYDWDDLPYDRDNRTLYRFKNNPEWRNQKSLYCEVTKKSDGTSLPMPSYTFRLSSLELVNKTSISARSAESMTKKAVSKPTLTLKEETAPSIFDEEIVSEKDDAHYAQMTIRDIYCIVNSVSLSNKTWLNKLIEEGKTWKK